MENYKLLERLGKGAQGSVFKVQNHADQCTYVLKKVECTEEGEANKAFKEAMALQDLKHRYICGYKEFFVTWDKEESAMYVCIVMEYYKMGDLDKALNIKRKQQVKVEEVVLKKWIGQMLEALVFVHNKQVIHRDLKPSNVFLTENLDVSIGDFGVATVMGDARTKTRTTVGSMIWMAPEVLERPYDERSDVWSLGCIILEMATCRFLDRAQVNAVLFDVKQSVNLLEEILEKVQEDYSKDLAQLIRAMLRKNFQQRPTTSELLDLPYIKECLALSQSHIAENKKAKKQSALAVPKGTDIPGTIEFMKKNKDNEVTVANALTHLNTFKTPVLTNEAKTLVMSLMREHVKDVSVQVQACRLLLTLVSAADPEEDGDDVLFSNKLIKNITLSMKAHGASKELQSVACLLLKSLAMNEQAAGTIGTLGGIQDILAAMRGFPNDADVCAHACSALSCLTINENNLTIIREESGVKDLMNAMGTHMEAASVIDSACTAMWGLSLEDENIETMGEHNAADLFLRAVQTHIKNPDVVKNACMALASLVSESEESAYAAMSENEQNKSGIQVVTEAYKQHHDDPDVAENVCCFYMEMSEIDDGLIALKKLNIASVLKSIKTKFADNEEIMCNVLDVLGKLGEGGGGKASARPQSARDKKRGK
ncbi:serine/threonine kinase-like domain-containing protein STKLD1 [Acanthaster planci]|uniref:non-specific serine/threonine protein kinase n=1 Tax=Acanthaster planci TaxID=133434 RepID=A0A8B7XWZ7_ACAPL|nr:serine/threonine kinase-like domain-containing protein STKLD1 [Acanthaster planci]